MRRTISIATVTLLLLAACSAQCEPIKLVYKFTKGEVDKYKTTMTANWSMSGVLPSSVPIPTSATATTTSIQKTLDVLPDGSARIQVTASLSGSGTAGKGKVQSTSASSSMILTITPQGRVTSVEAMTGLLGAAGGGVDPSQFARLAGERAIFSDGPVDIGATWATSLPVPMMNGSMSVSSTLVSAGEPFWSTTAAKIKQSFNGLFDLGQMMRSIAGAVQLSQKLRDQIVGVTGTMDMTGTANVLFSPELGKTLKADVHTRAVISVNLPAKNAKAGSPSHLDVVMEADESTTRFK